MSFMSFKSFGFVTASFKNFGFSDLSSFGREMLYVKVGADKRKERIWDLRGAVPLWSGNAECKMSHLVRGGRQTQQKKQSANKGKQFHLKGYFLCFYRTRVRSLVMLVSDSLPN